MLTLKQAVFVATLSLCSVTAWAQSTAPSKNVAPPPADLEPGVNTSATPPSSPGPEPVVAPAPKPAAPASKRAHAGTAASPTAATGTAGANTAPAPTPPANTATDSSSAAGTTASAKAGRTTTAAAPKPGAGSGKAHDNLELDTTQITGNRELPKVLYIVPWKRSDLGDLVGKPVNSLLDEVLTPVDRDVFKRQNRYYDALKPDDAKDAAGAASDPASAKH